MDLKSGYPITYSMLGAGLLSAQIERRLHPLTELFSLEHFKVHTVEIREI